MKRRLFSLTMILVLSMGMAATGWVPGTTGFSVQLTQAKTAAAMTSTPALMSNLRGSTVYDSSHQQIGKVDAVVINTNTSQIEYVVVGTGGASWAWARRISLCPGLMCR